MTAGAAPHSAQPQAAERICYEQMIMPNVVPRPHASPSYLGDFDLKRRHKNECYLVSASRTYLERSFGPHNSAGVRVGCNS